VAFNGSPYLRAQGINGFRFGKDGMTQGTGGVTAFWSLFNEKNKFVHRSYTPVDSQ
jgi:hypothetical protein